MLIQPGIKRKTSFGIHLRPQAPNFHQAFGTTMAFADVNRDSGLTNFNQNLPNPVFNTLAQPNGCTGMTTADVMTDLLKRAFSPWYCYTQTCQLEGVPVGGELEMTFALNEPVIAGLQAFDGSITKTGSWYQVTPLNGSLFNGLCSALTLGQSSISFASTWYQSFDTPVNGIVPPPSGLTSGHNWKICGIRTINGVQYLIGKPWLGSGWGADGFCYFSQAIIDQIGGTAFTPMDLAGETPVQVSTETIWQSIANLWKAILGLEEGSTGSLWQTLELEEEHIQKEIIDLTHPTMTPEQTLYTIASKSLGKHMTLDETVPAEVGCAEAVSAVLSLAGVSDGPAGIAGTASLYGWLKDNPRFVAVTEPEEGAIIISPTGMGNGSIEGHTGIIAAYNLAFPNDWGIMSNDSASGNFLELWNWTRWNLYYKDSGDLPVFLFRLV